MAGVQEVLDQYPDIKVVGRDTGKWGPGHRPAGDVELPRLSAQH
jgi:hypothetical protein